MGSMPAIAERTSVIELEGSIERVFPLFGPLRERQWAEGWNPKIVWPAGEAVRERMVFVTRSSHGQDGDKLWVVSRCDEAQATIEYTVFAKESVHWILIRCRSIENGESTEAEITYTYVGTSEAACFRNARDLAAKYRHDLKEWEHAINHFLRTGKRASHHP